MSICPATICHHFSVSTRLIIRSEMISGSVSTEPGNWRDTRVPSSLYARSAYASATTLKPFFRHCLCNFVFGNGHKKQSGINVLIAEQTASQVPGDCRIMVSIGPWHFTCCIEITGYLTKCLDRTDLIDEIIVEFNRFYIHSTSAKTDQIGRPGCAPTAVFDILAISIVCFNTCGSPA